MRLSRRMEANAALITPGSILCDVGCDHGYVPIALVERGIVSRAIAMDLRSGPLAKATENIAKAGLSDRIETRLSDGVAALQVGEADSILIAGMGGELVIHILTDGDRVCHSVKELILQPQSEIHLVRAYLRTHGYRIVAEDMVEEEGKYYSMMRVLPEKQDGTREPEAETEDAVDGPKDLELRQQAEDLYGPLLLAGKHAVLQEYLAKEEKNVLHIMENLKKQEESERQQARLAELQQEWDVTQFAQRMMEND